eukprot:gene42795-56886_t
MPVRGRLPTPAAHARARPVRPPQISARNLARPLLNKGKGRAGPRNSAVQRRTEELSGRRRPHMRFRDLGAASCGRLFCFAHRPGDGTDGVMMKKLKLVMVGNGMAGVRTIEELLKLAPDLYDITVFGAEPHPNYNRILLSPVLAGEQTLDEIVLNDWAWYTDNGVTLHAGKTVTQVDRVKRVVLAKDADG